MLLAVLGLILSSIALASAPAQPNASISVANGDFSDTANNGSIGGGALGGSGNGPIGSGPWAGAYEGVAGLIAPPTLTIGSGHAEIGGLVGLNVSGIVNNEARFHQDTGIAWQPNRRYTLEADIDAGVALGVSVLSSGNGGIALATGNNPTSRVASSMLGSPTLTLLSGTRYHLAIEYQTDASASGNIFLHLFSEPTNLVTANLLTSMSFDNVALHTYLLSQTPASIVPASPGPYTGTVGGAIDPDISVVVLDALGDPIAGVSVNYAVPASGPSATVVPNPAITDANGIAHVTVTANTIAGSYQIIATVTDVPTPIVYDMVNLAGPAAQLGNASGSGQDAVAGTPFAAPFGLQVQDQYGNPVSGVAVTFTAPSTGASSSFTPNPATTDANGRVSVTATANTIAGTYEVTASVAGVSPPITFELTNLAGPAASIGSLSGSGQGAITNTAFAASLGLQVLDQYGNPVPGSSVTFNAPGTGASAMLNPVNVTTAADGRASTSATANGIAGDYVITISVAGLGTVGSFNLTNMLDPTIVPADVGESNQNASITTPYSCALLVQIVDASGDGMPGLAVEFVAPASGPSATLTNGSMSGTHLQVSTDGDGFAWVDASANGIEGNFTVDAQLLYSLAPVTQFHLHNLAANDPILSNGFDGICMPFVGATTLETASE